MRMPDMDIWTGFKRTAFRMTHGWKEQEMFFLNSYYNMKKTQANG